MGDIAEQIDNLKKAEIAELATLYQRLFGSKPASSKKAFLIRQLAYKIQEQTFGGLSTAVTTRIRELTRIYDLIHKVVPCFFNL